MNDASRLTAKQISVLLAPISPTRVLKRDRMSYLAQHDVRAHLTRIFGFGNWSMDVLDTVLLYEDSYENPQRQNKTYWKVGYRVTVKLTICAPDGAPIAHYTDSHAEENAPQPSRGEAHALALTSATSYAMKRAATCLGDQFGLSLYNSGQETAFVRALVLGPEDGTATVTEGTKVEGEGHDVEGAVTEDEANQAAVSPNVPDDVAREAEATLMDPPAENRASDVDWPAIGADIHKAGTNPDASERAKALAALAKFVAANKGRSVSIPARDGEITVGRLLDKAMAGQFLAKAEEIA